MGAQRWSPAAGPGGIFLVGLVLGLAGQTLLFMDRQCRRVEALLLDDFRVLAFLAGDMPESRAKVVEEKVRALDGVEDVRYVSREAALAALRERDPELVQAVAILGENPLGAFLEVRLHPADVVRMPSWLEAARGIPELADIRFKPAQVGAIVQVQFYERFLALILGLAAFVWFAGAAGGLLDLVRGPEARQALREVLPRLASSGLGALAGMGIVYLATTPLKVEGRLWAWPPATEGAALALAGALGALLPEWGGGGERRRGRHRGGPSEPEAASAEVGNLAA